MKTRSGKRKLEKRIGGLSPTYNKIPKTQYEDRVTGNPTESLVNKSSLLPGHLLNYNDIVVQLIQRRAHYLSPNENNSSYEEWAKTQDQIALDNASSHSLEDILRARIKLTREKFIDNLNWKTMDVINYLISSHSDALPSPRSTNSSKRENFVYTHRHPIVLTASMRKTTKAGLIDHSKPAGTGKPTPKKGPTPKASSARLSSEKLREPAYPKKYQPTYKLSNYDYVKKGWTKLPDYSITYKHYTLGAEPAFPALWAFRVRTDGRKDFYPNTNKMAADFEGEKPYCVYYPNGEVAISISEGRVGPRLIVHSMSKKDESGRWIESQPQAMFDSKGNGVVYDLEGKMRMNYDQIEGAVYSYGKNTRPLLHWYWKESTFLRIRREDLQLVPPDHNDDIDPNRPDVDSRKSKSSKRSSKKKSRKKTSEKRKSKTPKSGRKSKVGGARKSKVNRKSKVAKKSNASQARKSKISTKSKAGTKQAVQSAKTRKSETPRKSATGTKKGKSRRKSMKKGGGTTKRFTRVDVPPLRKKPRHPKPITEVAPIAIKITDYVSMRIMNQQHIHLDFECGTVHYRLYLGVNVKPEVVERIDKIVNPKKVDNITPCYFELMPLRSMSLYYVNKKVQEMKKEAARREYKKNIRSVGGFYAWWLKKKRTAFEKRQNQQTQQFLMPTMSSIKIR